ncbi:MAG: hypothetical protein NTU53_02440, partial [Planctomycetota bacterium]|nr:hypothetical protein [Planctomycetota bacterium]
MPGSAHFLFDFARFCALLRAFARFCPVLPGFLPQKRPRETQNPPSPLHLRFSPPSAKLFFHSRSAANPSSTTPHENRHSKIINPLPHSSFIIHHSSFIIH